MSKCQNENAFDIPQADVKSFKSVNCTTNIGINENELEKLKPKIIANIRRYVQLYTNNGIRAVEMPQTTKIEK